MIDVVPSPEYAARKVKTVMMPLIMPRTTTPLSSGHSPMRANKQRELENYTQIHFRYTKLVQDQADAMHHNPREKDAAYARVAEESLAELKDMMRVPMKTTEEMQAILEDLARRTEIGPVTFNEPSISLA